MDWLLRYVEDQAAYLSTVAKASGLDESEQILTIRGGGGSSSGGNPIFMIFLHSLTVY